MLQVYGVKQFHQPGSGRPYNVRTDFLSAPVKTPTGIPLNSPINSSPGEALSLGAHLDLQNGFFNQDSANPYASAKIYTAYLAQSTDTWAPEFRKYGTAVMMVEVPEAGVWEVSITSGLLITRTMQLNLNVGSTAIEVTDLDAGNCRLGLRSVDTGHYYREEPLVVRAGMTTGVGVQFITTPDSPTRFSIKHLSVGQTSQKEDGTIPLIAWRSAMVRVMLQDGKGDIGESTKYLFLAVRDENGTYPIYNGPTIVSPNPVTTGTAQGGNPFVIPAHLVKPGIAIDAYLSATPFSSSFPFDHRVEPFLDRKTLQVQVNYPKSIVINTYDVRPFPGASGCPVARDPNGYWTQVARFMSDLYPNMGVTIAYRGKIWIADPLAGQSTITLLGTTMTTMNMLAAAEGHPQGDATHFYVGMINGRYISNEVPGMTWYGYPGTALAMFDPNGRTGHDLAHEMAHAMGLEHAPSPNANQYYLGLHINRVDGNYPYSGNGLSAGYGFSSLNNWFNKELERHWDPMSYDSPRTYSTAYFSDYFYQTLLNAGSQGRPGFPAPALGTDPYGIPVIDTSQAQQITSFMNVAMQPGDLCFQTTETTTGNQGQYLTTSTINAGTPHARRTTISGLNALGVTSLANPGIIYIDPGDGGGGSGGPGGSGGGGGTTSYPNPLNGDPDDPTPPILIVKKAPALPGQ
jgi:hypothetical protein